jgi:hypothetical protein
MTAVYLAASEPILRHSPKLRPSNPGSVRGFTAIDLVGHPLGVRELVRAGGRGRDDSKLLSRSARPIQTARPEVAQVPCAISRRGTRFLRPALTVDGVAPS